jgi:hypothetical protein
MSCGMPPIFKIKKHRNFTTWVLLYPKFIFPHGDGLVWHRWDNQSCGKFDRRSYFINNCIMSTCLLESIPNLPIV